MVCRRFVAVVRIGLWLSVAAWAGAPLYAQQPAPDNSKVNERDRAPSQATADQQKNNRSDVAITRDIRKAIVADKQLSTYAHNVKVITQHGEVTLKGPVRTDDEKRAVESKASEIAGAGHVKNQLSITTATPKPKRRVHKA